MTLDQFNRLDKCWYNFSLKDECEEEIVPARSLLGSNRFDLYAILLYIDGKVKNLTDISHHEDVYHARTGALSRYEYYETGKPDKNSFGAYLKDLDNLIEDYLNDNYDSDRSIIPVDKNGTLIDGAHRVSCAAYFNKDIKILRFVDKTVVPTTYKTLKGNMMPLEMTDASALEATKWHDDLYMLLFWPLSNENSNAFKASVDLIESEVDVLYMKEQVLSSNAIRNLMLQIYAHMDWLGNIDNNFKSVGYKVDSVWSPKGICHFILIRAKSTEDVLRLKGKIRDIFNCGLASIHSTDNIRETRIAADALFNKNSLHFLNYGNPTKFKECYKLLEIFKSVLVESSMDAGNYVLDSGMVLSMYGLRGSTDLDYICETSNDLIKLNSKIGQYGIERHGEKQLGYYNLNERDLIYNLNNYFTFNEVKFVSLPTLKRFKSTRFKNTGDPKDKKDVDLIDSVIGDSKLSGLKRLFKKIGWETHRHLWILKKNYRRIRKEILKKTGLYEPLLNLFIRIGVIKKTYK